MARWNGRRLRRGVTGTAVAAVAMAALTASQAPGLTTSSAAPDEVTPPPGPPISGGSPYYTELPPLVRPDKPGVSQDLPSTPLPGRGVRDGAGIPATVLAAYKEAELTLAKSHPGCHLPWQLLAAIGQVESGQASDGNVDAGGTTYAPIRGPKLDGNGFAHIADTDDGALDGDTTHDRAVGPMQFIPSTWVTWGADANGDGADDPDNVYDAALAAGRYLCAGDRDLADSYDLDRAILGYNHSHTYLQTVKSWLSYFQEGYHQVGDRAGGVAPVHISDPGDGPAVKPGTRDSAEEKNTRGNSRSREGEERSEVGGTRPARPSEAVTGSVRPAPKAEAKPERPKPERPKPEQPEPEQPEPEQPEPEQPEPEQPDPGQQGPDHGDSDEPTCPAPGSDPEDQESPSPSESASPQPSPSTSPGDSSDPGDPEGQHPECAPPPSDEGANDSEDGDGGQASPASSAETSSSRPR